MKPLAVAADAAVYGVCMGVRCGGMALSGIVVVGARVEDGKLRWLELSSASAKGVEEDSAMGFWVPKHTSVLHGGPCRVSGRGSRSRSVNETPQVNCPRHKLLRGEPLDD